MLTKYFVEFIYNSSTEDCVIESKWFKTEKLAKKWIVKEFSDINFDKISIFIHRVDFKKNSGFGDIILSKKFTEKDYFKIKGE